MATGICSVCQGQVGIFWVPVEDEEELDVFVREVLNYRLYTHDNQAGRVCQGSSQHPQSIKKDNSAVVNRGEINQGAGSTK